MAEFYRTEIQKALRALIVAGPFYPVAYNSDTKEPIVTEVHQAPSAVVLNEVSANFGEAILNRREHALERTAWQFQAFVHFDQEVLCEVFERTVCRPIPKLARASSVGRSQQVEFRLLNVAYEHPTQQDGSSGTRCSYIFEARLSPI